MSKGKAAGKRSPSRKKEKRLTSYRREYHQENSFIVPVKDNKYIARCELCQSNIKICYGGESAIKSHKETKKHKENAKKGKTAAGSSVTPSTNVECADNSEAKEKMTQTLERPSDELPVLNAPSAVQVTKDGAKPFDADDEDFAAIRNEAHEAIESIIEVSKKIAKELPNSSKTGHLFQSMAKLDTAVGESLQELLDSRRNTAAESSGGKQVCFAEECPAEEEFCSTTGASP